MRCSIIPGWKFVVRFTTSPLPIRCCWKSAFPRCLQENQSTASECPQVKYGINYHPNLELEAQLITGTPFSKYMENFSEYRQGLWEIAKEIGKSAGLKLNVEKLRKKHADIRWQIAS